jgi:hypothetical protein
MTRTELFAYLLVAVLGSVIAGYAGGLIGVLGVFGGLGLVAFTEVLVILHQVEA